MHHVTQPLALIKPSSLTDFAEDRELPSRIKPEANLYQSLYLTTFRAMLSEQSGSMTVYGPQGKVCDDAALGPPIICIARITINHQPFTPRMS